MEPLKHSGLGIASFVTSICAGGMLFVVVVTAGVMEASAPGGMDEKSAGAIIIGLFMFLLLFVELVAMGIGVGGLFQKERKKIFAILGIVFSLASILGVICLMLIGLSLK
ncbi:MAG: hypothetical protein QF408_00470 [Pirellulales bacterium]|nr:hypothetical protein [Pirellulales bacterium]